MILATMSHLFTSFCIRSEGGIGTAFAYKDSHRTLFLTASHVLGGAAAGGFVHFKKPVGWIPFELTGVTRHPHGHDAATFGIAGLAVEVEHAFSYGDDPDFGLGEEVKFTGFPHGLENTAPSPIGYSTPLVRTAFFSGIIVDPTHQRSLLILDGLNNPGYSGGPVWAPGRTKERPTLIGLISGYRVEERGKSRVYQAAPDGKEQVTDDLFVKPNSGMIHAVPYADVMTLVSASNDCNAP